MINMIGSEYMKSSNFSWLVDDIYASVIIKLFYNDEDFGTYEACDIRDVTGSLIDVEFANIDDITNLLTLSVVRFINIVDKDSFIDIPIRNLYKLYRDENEKNYIMSEREISMDELDGFSVVDGTIGNNNYKIKVFVTNMITDDLKQMYEFARVFGNLDMQEKFNALSSVNSIGYKRILRDKEI